MAYVAITDDTTNEIRQKITALLERELNSLGAPPIYNTLHGNPLKADLVETYFWKNYEHLRNTTPTEWMVKFRSLRVKLVDSKGAPVMGYEGHARQVFIENGSLAADREMLLPPVRNDCNQYHNTLMLTPEYFGLTDEHIANLKAYNERRRAVVDKWIGVRAQVTRFLENCKSLNQAIKLMPSFRLYVPEGMLRRIDEKVSRSPTKGKNDSNPMDGIDVGALNMAAVTAKILGA
jgi:hypothetical protein